MLFDTRKRAIDKTEKHGRVQWKGLKKKAVNIKFSLDVIPLVSPQYDIYCDIGVKKTNEDPAIEQ